MKLSPKRKVVVKKSGGIIKAQSYFWNYGGSRKRLDAAIDAARGAK